MQVRLNLATKPLENNRRFLLGAGISGTLALVLLLVLSTSTFRIWRQNREVRSEISRLESEMSALRDERKQLEIFFKQADTKQSMERAQLLNGLIEQRSFPWTRVFMDLERLLPDGVRLVSISPQMQGDKVEVRLVVGASSDELMNKFLRTLDESKSFTSVQVLSQSRPTRPDAPDRILFDVVALYSTT